MRVRYLFSCGYDDQLVFHSCIYYYVDKYPFRKILYKWENKMPNEEPDTINKFACDARFAAFCILKELRPKSKLYDLHNPYHREEIEIYLHKRKLRQSVKK